MPDFWDFIFKGDVEGYVRVALRTRGGKFTQFFIKWPDEKSKLVATTNSKGKGDLYFTPSLYKPSCLTNERPGSKANVLGSWVAWADLDRRTATRSPEGPPAGLVVASGSEGHRHLYWRSNRFLDPVLLEQWNLELQRINDADPSGWDCNQFLRVPGTINYKSDPPLPVKLLVCNPGLITPPPTEFKHTVVKVHDIDEADKPSVTDVLLNHDRLNPYTEKLLKQTKAEDRSRDLFSLSCLLFEQNFTIPEVHTLLTFADERWGKFHLRDDKEARISEIISRTSDRKPNVSFELGREFERRELQPVGWRSLATSEHKIKWVVEGILRERGFLFVTGDAGVGKSTLLLNMGARLVLQGTDWAGFTISRNPQRILFGSHEMDEEELNYFMGHMNGGLTVEMQDVLEQGFLFLPIGHAVYLDTLEGREFYDKALRDNDYTGLILDTLGASVSSSLSDEVTARGVCDWVDHVRKDYGVWVAIIHHPRKAAPGGKTGSRLDDTYGSRIFADRANSVLHLKKGKGDTVELISHKTRLSKTTEFKVLRKSTTLWYDVEETVPVGGESSVKEVSMSFNDNEIKDLPGEGDTDELNG